jgi:hypothetical protein
MLRHHFFSRLDYRVVFLIYINLVILIDDEVPPGSTTAMNDQYQKVMRDSFLTNIKTINDINQCKMEVTRKFWQDMHDSRACTCNLCGASSRGNADHHDIRRVVLLLPEFPIIINVRNWYCEECKVIDLINY